MSIKSFSFSEHPPASFYVSGGTLGHDAPCYVTRRADADLYVSLKNGVFCYVLTARQMGKSSLMVRTAARLRQEGSTALVLDLTAIGQNVTVEQWYRGVLGAVGEQLDREDLLAELWREQSDRSPVQRWTKAICKVALDLQPGNVVIFVDEVDAVLNLPFSGDEFFAAIRELHNRRAEYPDLSRLTFCLLGVASPSDLIRDPRTTPFNIARRIELSDFTETEAASLTRGLARPATLGTALLRRVLYWTGGHPYLTQRLCQVVAGDPALSGPADVDRTCQTLFFSHRALERDDNLVFVRERLLRSDVDLASLLGLYATVLRGNRVHDDESNPLISILRLSGITRGEDGRLVVRNRIYSHVFDRRWVAESMPGAEMRRQRAAYHRGLLRAAAVSLIVLTIMTVLVVVAVKQRNRAEQEVLRNRRMLYRQNMILAQQDWETGYIGRMREFVDNFLPTPGQEDLRGFEWYYLWRLCHNERLTLRHADAVRMAVFSPDGKRLVTGNDDHTVRLWDVATGRELANFKGHRGVVWFLEFSPDGRRLATASLDKTAKLWDVDAGEELMTFVGHSDWVYRASFSCGGGGLFTASKDGTMKHWDIATGRALATFKWKAGAYAGVSPDGCALATIVDNGNGKLWEVDTGRELATLGGYVNVPLTFSDDGKRLAARSDGNTAKIWEVPAGQVLATFEGHEGPVQTIKFSRDGKRLATGGRDRVVKVWDAITGQELHTFKGHSEEPHFLAFSPDDQILATGGGDRTVKLWDIAETQEPTTLKGHGEAVNSVAFSPDGKKLATASSDRTVRLWELETGRELATLKGHTGPVWSVRFSPDGSRLATGSDDRTVKLWAVATGQELVTLKGHTGGVFPVSFSPDGKELATGSHDCTVKLWDVRTGLELATIKGHRDPVWAVVFSPDGKMLATGSHDQTVKLWDVATCQKLITLKGHTAGVLSIAFSPDGSTLATGSEHRTVKLWDVATGHELTTLRDLGDLVYCLAFSPDGKRIAAGSDDHTVKLWEAMTGDELATFKGAQRTSLVGGVFPRR